MQLGLHVQVYVMMLSAEMLYFLTAQLNLFIFFKKKTLSSTKAVFLKHFYELFLILATFPMHKVCEID